jgi:hypothetical protein
MSNFVHKVKDAITDHDKPVTRSQTSTNPNQNKANPLSSGYDRYENAPRMSHEEDADPGLNRPGNTGYDTAPGYKTQGPTQYGEYPRGATTASEAREPTSDNRNSTLPPDDVSSSATSSSNMNAGPHQSKLANKLDPRVDSDPATGNRGQQAPAGLQRENAGNQGMSSSNMPAQQPTFNQGMDNHSSSEDKFSKSTEEHRHSNQPTRSGFDDNQVTGETQDEDFSASTQEQKSHKATSHISPCTSGGLGSEQTSDNRANQPNFGGDSAGGSSYNQNVGARGPEGGQDTTMLQKPGTGAKNLPAGQQNMGEDQRVRY